MTKGRVLIVGSTGFIGNFVAEASIHSGRPTYILVRPGSDSIRKAKVVESLQQRGAIVLHGVITNKKMMEKMLREYEIEIVISAVGGKNVRDQSILVDAIKSVGTVKRFIPSEFGHDVDRANPVEPGLSMYQEKRDIRRLIEKFDIPYTYICCNSIASWPYHDNPHPSDVLPPLDRFQIYGQGTVKAYFVDGADIGKFTLKAVEDVRTLNKCVHFRPSCNYYNMNELASLWETKINRTLPRIKFTENELLAAAAVIGPRSTLIEIMGMGHTYICYICCNSIASWPYHDNPHPSDVLPPLDRFQIYGQGTVKAYFVDGADIGKFTLKAVEDVRTLNKCVHFRPSCNYYNMNELASLWETKINSTLPRIKFTENELLAAAAGSSKKIH
ncbi:hypothetical protein ACFE04_029559 [Oxalis oulophora]